MKNNLIIFSKNRACQLHLLLESLSKNTHNLFDNINILYKSDIEFISGYNKVKKHFPQYNFLLEKYFRHNLLTLLSDEYEFTTFMVDDQVVYMDIIRDKNEILNVINENVVCFSLRLGYNCIYSHPANLFYEIVNPKQVNGFLMFEHREQPPGDNSYPLSTDGHIYKTGFIKELLNSTNFTNPNTLEANIQYYVTKTPPTMFSFIKSMVVSVPVNLVNTTFKNRHGIEFYFSEKELNDRYLNNEIIDINSLDFTNINGPHKEIEYVFTENKNN